MIIPYDNVAEITKVYYMPSVGVVLKKYGAKWSVSSIAWTELDVVNGSTMEVKLDTKNGALAFNASLSLILARQDPKFWETIGTPSLFLVVDGNGSYWLVIDPIVKAGKMSFAGFNGRSAQLESVMVHAPLEIDERTVWIAPTYTVELVPITEKIYQGQPFSFGLKATNTGTIPVIETFMIKLESEYIYIQISV
jgi:hypothetical protein